ncbi:hypothetical protein ACIQI8_43050 [Streptomyces sp. NPDC092369]
MSGDQLVTDAVAVRMVVPELRAHGFRFVKRSQLTGTASTHG